MKAGEKYLTIFSVFLITISFSLLLYRIHFGIDFTDESLYVAEPYIVANGAVPYATNVTQMCGFSVPLAIAYKVFSMANKGTEGIVLFSRYLYCIWMAVIYFLTLFILRRNTSFKVPYIVLAPMLFFSVSSLFDLSYNTVGQIYLPLALALLFSMWNTMENKTAMQYGFFAGLVMARAVLGTLQMIMSCGMLLLVLMFYRKKGRLTGYILGGTLFAVGFICYVFLAAGVRQFINGMYILLNDFGYFQITKKYTLEGVVATYWVLLKPCLVYFLVLIGIFLCCRKNNNLRESISTGFILLLEIYGLYAGRDVGSYTMAGYFIHVIPLIMCFFPEKRREMKWQLSAIVVGVYVSAFLFVIHNNVFGTTGRQYWFYVPIVMTILMTASLINQEMFKSFYVVGMSAVLFALFLRFNYINIYRDAPFLELTTRIERGIWKGCYTTEERASDVMKLESELRQMTAKEDNVLCLDWVSFAYLMTDGKICSASSGDTSGYSYGVNDPSSYFDYFYSTNSIPDKIIYVDYGRDERLSIETEEWRFNEFVLSFYELSDAKVISERVRYKCYRLKDRTGAESMIDEVTNFK